jgi:hypothetical protein
MFRIVEHGLDPIYRFRGIIKLKIGTRGLSARNQSADRAVVAEAVQTPGGARDHERCPAAEEEEGDL